MSSTSVDLHKVALDYHSRGWNVIPVQGKRPSVSGWKQWQQKSMDVGEINRLESYWREATGIAVVCGAISGNLVVVDLDGQEAINLFYSQFPQLTRTHTVKTGNGLHLYYHQHHKYIKSGKAVHKLVVGTGEIAVRVQNCYVVAPPSQHPSGKQYKVEADWKIKRTATLQRVVSWITTQNNTSKESEIQAPISYEADKPQSMNFTDADHGKEWGATALANELAIISSAGQGGRNDQLYKSAIKLGSIIAGGYLPQSLVESQLMVGADLCGLVKDDGRAQCEKTIQGGIEVGMRSPRHPSNNSPPSPSNGNKPDMDKSPEDKDAEDKHPLPMNPDAEQLATFIKGKMQSQYSYFQDSWQLYSDGVWRPIKNLNKGITYHIKMLRGRGVKANPATVNNVSFFLQTEMELMDENIIDDYPDYIATANGMFNLQDMMLKDFRPDIYVTGKTSWEYNPKATCPTFLKWLSSMLTYPDGTPDPLMMYFVQEAFGYSLTTDTRYRMSFWLKGPKHSGKSTLLEVLSEMLSIYHGVLDLNQLDKNRFLLALTYGKRVVTCAEVEKGLKINDGQYKQLVDNASKVVADIKNREPITFKPTAKVWWAMNNFPRITDNTGAVHSRVAVIPYHRSITIEERDLDLLGKIRCELSGVFNWALEGLMRLNYNRRFTAVPQSDDIKTELEVKDSVYRQFLDDEQWCRPEEFTLSRNLNDAFITWCKVQGIRNTGSSDRRRKSEFLDAGLEYDRTAGISKYMGVQLTEHAMRHVNLILN